MLLDLRDTPLYREVEQLYEAMRKPGTGQIYEAVDLNSSPDGRHAIFAGTMAETLDATAPSRICLTDLATGETRALTFGPNTDRSPKYSPDGSWIAFLSDRNRSGDFQLFFLDPVNGAAKARPRVEGWIEYLHWSPDGQRILLGVAGHGADVGGAQGAITTKQKGEILPPWMPLIETGDEGYRWRSLWVYELASDTVSQVSPDGLNIWEASWCGNEAIAAVASPQPGEGFWYSAGLQIIDIKSGNSRRVHAPRDQIGLPAATPDGRHLAIVEAVCSDRKIVAGNVLLIDTSSGVVRGIDTGGVDVTYTEWRSNGHLLVAGHRGFETVVGLYDLTRDVFREIWASTEISTGLHYIAVSGFGETGDFAFVSESFTRGPEIAVVRAGDYRTAKSFDLGYGELARGIDAVDRVSWKASDGLEIQGWLLRPKGKGPFPLIMNIHGGPVWGWHPLSLTRSRFGFLFMLLLRGYAIFLPNPRGSGGRGQDFARMVVGDVGGADTYDYLSGIDHLVEQGLADPKRLGVTGVSYGGYMSSWLIAQDHRFAAAAPLAPVTNKVSQHLVSNIPQFIELFMGDKYYNPGGAYFTRSPIMHAHKVKTPSLNICGALDRCTPPGEAMQFHNALRGVGTESILLTYPQEGHGIQAFPAAIDVATRVVEWFERHMPA